MPSEKKHECRDLEEKASFSGGGHSLDEVWKDDNPFATHLVRSQFQESSCCHKGPSDNNQSYVYKSLNEWRSNNRWWEGDIYETDELRDEMQRCGVYEEGYFVQSLGDAFQICPEKNCKVVHGFIIREYTKQHLYKKLNAALRNGDFDAFPKITRTLYQALHASTPLNQIVFRGLDLKPSDAGINLGIWLNQQFLSCSTTSKRTQHFQGKKAFKTLLIIKTVSGRRIEWISQSPFEREVIIPPFTLFQVTRIEEPDSYNNGQFKVHLEEVRVATKSEERVLLIIDDDLTSQSIKWNITLAERCGIRILTANSTQEAREVLSKKEHKHLLGLSTDQFRIISDMKRGNQPDAGAKFARILRDEYNYNEEIMFYVTYRSSTRTHLEKEGLDLRSIRVENSEDCVEPWVCFEQPVPKIYEYLPVNDNPPDEILEIEHNELCDCVEEKNGNAQVPLKQKSDSLKDTLKSWFG